MAKSLREAAAARRRKRKEGGPSQEDAAPEIAAPEAPTPDDAAPEAAGIADVSSELPRRKKQGRPLDLDNPYAPPQASLDGAPRSKRRAPLFAVPTGKMVVMSITTCGLWELYWFYKNWQLVLREGRQVSPLGRAFFSGIFAYSLFKRIRDEALGAGIQTSLPPGLLAIMFIIGHFAWQVPGAAWLGVIGVVPTIAANATARATNDALDVGSEADDRFSAWNIIAATLGGLALLFTLAARR